MDEYSIRPSNVHVRGCPHDGLDGSSSFQHDHNAERCRGCGAGHLVNAQRASAALASGRPACATCRPDLVLDVQSSPTPDLIEAAELRGYTRAMTIVARALREAMAEPRPLDRSTTERGGRICALGNVLQDLAEEGTHDAHTP